MNELKRFEQWWDAGDDIPNDGPYTPDTPIQFASAGWQAALAQRKPLTDDEIEAVWLKHHDENGYLRNENQEGWAYEKELLAKFKEKNT